VSDKVEAKVAGVFASGEGSQAKSEDKYADKLPEESRGQKRTEGVEGVGGVDGAGEKTHWGWKFGGSTAGRGGGSSKVEEQVPKPEKKGWILSALWAALVTMAVPVALTVVWSVWPTLSATVAVVVGWVRGGYVGGGGAGEESGSANGAEGRHLAPPRATIRHRLSETASKPRHGHGSVAGGDAQVDAEFEHGRSHHHAVQTKQELSPHRREMLQHMTPSEHDPPPPTHHIHHTHHAHGHGQGAHHALQDRRSEHAHAGAGADDEHSSSSSTPAAPASYFSRVPAVGLLEVAVVAAICVLFIN